MGWWSATVMGGDTPLDFENEIYNHLGIEMYPENSDEKNILPKEALEKEQDAIVRNLSSDDEAEIGLQVIGVIMMEAGAKISAKNKKLIIKAAENDEWAKEDGERRKHMKDFISTLKKYDGTASATIKNESVSEAFAKHKGGGLINKNVKQPK